MIAGYGLFVFKNFSIPGQEIVVLLPQKDNHKNSDIAKHTEVYAVDGSDDLFQICCKVLWSSHLLLWWRRPQMN